MRPQRYISQRAGGMPWLFHEITASGPREAETENREIYPVLRGEDSVVKVCAKGARVILGNEQAPDPGVNPPATALHRQ